MGNFSTWLFSGRYRSIEVTDVAGKAREAVQHTVRGRIKFSLRTTDINCISKL